MDHSHQTAYIKPHTHTHTHRYRNKCLALSCDLMAGFYRTLSLKTQTHWTNSRSLCLAGCGLLQCLLNLSPLNSLEQGFTVH